LVKYSIHVEPRLRMNDAVYLHAHILLHGVCLIKHRDNFVYLVKQMKTNQITFFIYK
jgi:hypothetical protein